MKGVFLLVRGDEGEEGDIWIDNFDNYFQFHAAC